MAEKLTLNEIDTILQALAQAKLAKESAKIPEDYPTMEFKRQQLEAVESALRSVRAIRDSIS